MCSTYLQYQEDRQKSQRNEGRAQAEQVKGSPPDSLYEEQRDYRHDEHDCSEGQGGVLSHRVRETGADKDDGRVEHNLQCRGV